MDYIGVGQNKKYIDPDLMQIESQGKAYAELIRLIPDKNVVIYGHSFGTTVATVAASILTKVSKSSQKFEGVFLEGIVGKGNYEKANLTTCFGS
jgi:pimeloyl-ACP methyl ester carboxylesterase